MKMQCVRCLTLKSRRWIVCVASNGGGKEVFCIKCHRLGFKSGFSYIGDPFYGDNSEGEKR